MRGRRKRKEEGLRCVVQRCVVLFCVVPLFVCLSMSASPCLLCCPVPCPCDCSSCVSLSVRVSLPVC